VYSIDRQGKMVWRRRILGGNMTCELDLGPMRLLQIWIHEKYELEPVSSVGKWTNGGLGSSSENMKCCGGR